MAIACDRGQLPAPLTAPFAGPARARCGDDGRSAGTVPEGARNVPENARIVTNDAYAELSRTYKSAPGILGKTQRCPRILRVASIGMTALERRVNMTAVLLPFVVVAIAVPLLWGDLVGWSDVAV